MDRDGIAGRRLARTATTTTKEQKKNTQKKKEGVKVHRCESKTAKDRRQRSPFFLTAHH